MILTVLLAGLAQAKDPCASEADQVANSEAIQAIYDASEAEREDRSAQATSVLKRDEKRVKAMAKLDSKGRLCTAADKFNAAWVMQQADKATTLERAYELAVETMEERLQRGPWLVAFTFDHKRTARGYRQSYGTQTRVDGRGHRCLIELEGDITDEQRAKYGVPKLEDIYRKILDLNGHTDEAATLDRMNRNSLLCPPLAIDPADQKRVAPPT